MADLAADDDFPTVETHAREAGGVGNDAIPTEEPETAADRLSEADADDATVSANVAHSLKRQLVSRHGIDAGDAELLLTATDPELLVKQVDRLLALRDEQVLGGHIVPNEGRTPTPIGRGESPMQEFVRNLFDNPD